MSEPGLPVGQPRKLRKSRSASDVGSGSLSKRFGKFVSKVLDKAPTSPGKTDLTPASASSTSPTQSLALESLRASVGSSGSQRASLPIRTGLPFDTENPPLETLPEVESTPAKSRLPSKPPRISIPPTGSDDLGAVETLFQQYSSRETSSAPARSQSLGQLQLHVNPEFTTDPVYSTFPRSPRPDTIPPVSSDNDPSPPKSTSSESSQETERADESSKPLPTLSSSIGENRSLISSSLPEARHPELGGLDSPLTLTRGSGSPISPFSTLRSVPAGFQAPDSPTPMSAPVITKTPAQVANLPPNPDQTPGGGGAVPVTPVTRDRPQTSAPAVSPMGLTLPGQQVTGVAPRVYISPIWELNPTALKHLGLHPSHTAALKIPHMKDLIGRFKRALVQDISKRDAVRKVQRQVYEDVQVHFQALPFDKRMRVFIRTYLKGLANPEDESIPHLTPDQLVTCFATHYYKEHPREVIIALRTQLTIPPEEEYWTYAVQPWHTSTFSDHCWEEFTKRFPSSLSIPIHRILTLEPPIDDYPHDLPYDEDVDQSLIYKALRVTLANAEFRVAFVRALYRDVEPQEDPAIKEAFNTFLGNMVYLGMVVSDLELAAANPDSYSLEFMYCHIPTSDYSEGEDAVELAMIQESHRKNVESKKAQQKRESTHGYDLSTTAEGARQSSLVFATTRDGRQLPMPETPASILKRGTYGRPSAFIPPILGYQESLQRGTPVAMAGGTGGGPPGQPPDPPSHGFGAADNDDRRQGPDPRDRDPNRTNRNPASGGGGGGGGPPHGGGGGGGGDSSDSDRPRHHNEDSSDTEVEARYIHGKRGWKNLSEEAKQKERVDIRRKRHHRQRDRGRYSTEKPSKIKGDDPKAVEPWLIQCSAYLKAKLISRTNGKSVCDTLALFTEDSDVIHWLNAYRSVYTTWKQFTADFWSQFGDTTITVRAKVQFHTKNLSQQTGETFPKFLKRMTSLRIDCLYQEDNVIFIDRFYYSLHPELRKMVPEPDTHTTFRALVYECEQVCHRIPAIQEGYRGWTASRTNTGNTQRADTNRRPQQQYNPNRHPANPTNTAATPGTRATVPAIKITPSMDGVPIEFQGDIRDPAVRAHLANSGRCFTCRKPGHTSRNCPDSKAPPQTNYQSTAAPRYHYSSASAEAEEPPADEEYYTQSFDEPDSGQPETATEELPDLEPSDETAPASGK